IEQEKKLETLKAENDSLAKELNSMKKDLEMIKSLLLTTKKVMNEESLLHFMHVGNTFTLVPSGSV
ncbi:MAG: septum formation initiator family protein, partial [Croceitalea sp.]|nr:septum formation initiator family protein [Croceitalea sp.]